MELLIAAMIMGLLGSLHCVGMCGPLLLGVYTARKPHGSIPLRIILMQLGRITSYALMGLAMGLIGKVISLAGFQQYLSIISGILLILVTIGYLIPKRWTFMQQTNFKVLQSFKTLLHNLLKKKNKTQDFYMGLMNGFLPCGLVYFALSASLSAPHIYISALYMIVFGIFTSPLLLTVVLAVDQLQNRINFQFKRLIPVLMLTMGVLLILRGSNLNIPYVSPDMTTCAQGKSCCHK